MAMKLKKIRSGFPRRFKAKSKAKAKDREELRNELMQLSTGKDHGAIVDPRTLPIEITVEKRNPTNDDNASEAGSRDSVEVEARTIDEIDSTGPAIPASTWSGYKLMSNYKFSHPALPHPPTARITNIESEVTTASSKDSDQAVIVAAPSCDIAIDCELPTKNEGATPSIVTVVAPKDSELVAREDGATPSIVTTAAPKDPDQVAVVAAPPSYDIAIESVLTSRSFSELPTKDSTAIGGPKYYVVANNDTREARIYHEAMPVSNADLNAIQDERGYEVVEYEHHRKRILHSVLKTELPTKESQPLGGPKYYIVSNKKTDEALLYHEAMPSYDEEDDDNLIPDCLSCAGDHDVMVEEERGYEVVEYDLVRRE